MDFYVRKTGADSNSGSSNGTGPDRSGADMATTNGSTQVTSASGAFTAPDVGKTIMIATVLYRIATVTNGTTIQLERVYAGTTGASRAWAIGGALLTIGKLLATTAAIMQNGDTLWVGAGTYREVVTLNMTSLTAMGYIKGDVDGVKTGDPGEVVWTAYTTNDKTAPSGTPNLTYNARDFLSVQRITFVSGSNVIVSAGTATSTNCELIDCTFIGGNNANPAQCIDIVNAAGVALNWLIDRCRFLYARGGPVVLFTLVPSGVADYSVLSTIRNCLFAGAATAVQIGASSGTGKPGGVALLNCTMLFHTSAAVRINDAFQSTTFPTTINNCFVYMGSGTALIGNTSGCLVEDYNVILANTARSNVATGANSNVNAYAPLLHIGQELQVGTRPRPFAMPASGSPLLGWGGSGPPSVDILNYPRPAGGASALAAVGAFERGNTFGKETGTVRTGTNAISITGPGYQDFTLRVNAVSTTVTAYVRWDATYAGTKPRMQVLGGTECGVADATATAVGSSGAWELLTLTFTPTAKGIVKVRFLSSDTNGGGHVYVDDLLAA